MSDSQFSPITHAVIDGNPEDVIHLVTKARENQDPHSILDELIIGIRYIGDRFGAGDLYLPDLMIGAKTMKAGLALIQSDLAKNSMIGDQENQGKILIGTVNGDLHDIGKSLVALLLEVNGYEVHDLGVDVSSERFISEAERLNVDIIALSSLLTTTAAHIHDVVNMLQKGNLREKYQVIIGGAATSTSFASQVGVDGWAENANDAVKLVDKLMVIKLTKK